MRQRGRPPHPDILTPRQWQVLELLCEGLTNEQIAGRLGISVDGAKFHVSEILGKLAVGSRDEAAQWQREEQPAAPSAALARGRRRSRRRGSGVRRVGRGVACRRVLTIAA